MKQFQKLFLSIIMMAIALALNSPVSAGEWDKVRIGTEGAYPPFNYVDKDGNLQGFDIDIAKALCEEMGVKYEFVVQDWDGIIPGLLAKKYDVIIASMSITEERKQKVDFTEKYYLTPARFVTKKGADIEISREGLKGKTVGVQRATIHENFLRDNFGKAVDIKSYATQDEANMDLVSGRVDLVIADATVLLGASLRLTQVQATHLWAQDSRTKNGLAKELALRFEKVMMPFEKCLTRQSRASAKREYTRR